VAENDAELAAEASAAGVSPAENPAAGEPEAEPEPEAKPARRFRFPIKSLLALVVIVLLVLPVYSTLQPAYYERYPELRGRIAAWRVSTHARISCAGCHVDPGALGMLQFAAKSIPAFYSQLIGGPKSQNLLGVPNRAACQKCHTSYRQVSTSGDLLIPHRAHVEVLGINCPVCHKNLVHTLNKDGFNKPEMSTCLTLCHDGVKATNQCNKCHTRKEVPASHLRKDWLTIHPTMTETINCGQCHAFSPNYCKDCHSKRPASHVGNWKTQHAARAKARGTKGCLFCHGQAFCNKCH
jgi:hypothetical protein